MKNLMSFNQFNVDNNTEHIDEKSLLLSLFTNENKQINKIVKNLTNDINDKKSLKKLKKYYDDYMKHANNQRYNAIKVRLKKSVKELTNFLENGGDKLPSDFEKLVAIVVLRDDDVVKKGDKWKALTKVAPHGTGGAGNASWN